MSSLTRAINKMEIEPMILEKVPEPKIKKRKLYPKIRKCIPVLTVLNIIVWVCILSYLAISIKYPQNRNKTMVYDQHNESAIPNHDGNDISLEDENEQSNYKEPAFLDLNNDSVLSQYSLTDIVRLTFPNKTTENLNGENITNLFYIEDGGAEALRKNGMLDFSE